MLESGMPIDIVDEFGDTALMGAAFHNRTEVVRCLLEKGANVNQETLYGWTALHFASLHNNTDVIKILVQHGASSAPIDWELDRWPDNLWEPMELDLWESL